LVAIKEFMTVHLIASEACSYRNRYKLSDGIPNPVIPESAEALLLREIQRKLSRAGLNPASTPQILTPHPLRKSCLIKISNYS
jgi:hypothetical protein